MVQIKAQFVGERQNLNYYWMKQLEEQLVSMLALEAEHARIDLHVDEIDIV